MQPARIAINARRIADCVISQSAICNSDPIIYAIAIRDNIARKLANCRSDKSRAELNSQLIAYNAAINLLKRLA